MYMQKDELISRDMLGGSLATQQSPGQLSGSPCGGVMCTLDLLVKAAVLHCMCMYVCVQLCTSFQKCRKVLRLRVLHSRWHSLQQAPFM